MPRETKKQRNAKQSIRQQLVRDNTKERRRPERDDLARMVLWQLIRSAERHRLGRREALDRLRNKIVEGLEYQGFNVFESEDVFEELARSYADGLFPFRPKRHLAPF